MDRVVAARKLIAELVKGEQIELRRAEIVGRDLAGLVETLERPPTGRELEDFLGDHAQVTELYASTSLLEELVYRYLTPAPVVARATEARNPELERELRDAPDLAAPYLVYADWLQEQGDPLGELIALGVATATGGEDAVARFARHLKLYDDYFLGGLGRGVADHLTVEWRHGFVRAIEERVEVMDALAPSAWEQLLGLRVCELVQSLTLRRRRDREVQIALVAAAPASLRSLALEAWDGPLPELRHPLRALAIRGSSVVLGALPPTLERLELRTIEVTGELHSELRELDVFPSVSAFELLAAAQLPRLERLTLGGFQGSAAKLTELLASMHLPALVHLGIRDGTLEPRTLTAIARLPVAAGLTSLALTHLGLTDDVIEPMARTKFPALTELDLTGNELTRDGLELARKLAPNVISRRQYKPGSAAERRVRRFAGTRLQVAEDIADPKLWRRAGVDGEVRWARYRGEDEYELFVTADLQRYACSCPSSIQPCKHVVALALVAERTGLREAPSDGIETRLASRAERERYDLVVE